MGEYGRRLGFAQTEGLAVGSRQPAADGPAAAEKATSPGTAHTLPVRQLLSVALSSRTRNVVFFNVSPPALRHLALFSFIFVREILFQCRSCEAEGNFLSRSCEAERNFLSRSCEAERNFHSRSCEAASIEAFSSMSPFFFS